MALSFTSTASIWRIKLEFSLRLKYFVVVVVVVVFFVFCGGWKTGEPRKSAGSKDENQQQGQPKALMVISEKQSQKRFHTKVLNEIICNPITIDVRPWYLNF